MKYLEPKSPDDTKFFVLDYSKLISPDSIDTKVVTVSSGTVELIRTVSNSTAIGIMVSGGVDQEVATFDITINTVGKQVFTDQATMFILSDVTQIDFDILTKGQIVQWAWQDLRLSGYTFDHTADENEAMLARLDGLMRKWRIQKRDPGYNHPKTIGQSELNDIAGFLDGLGTSVATILAAEYMDGIGKSFTPSFLRKLNKAESFTYAYTKGIPNRALPANTPHGAGMVNWSLYFPFFGNQTTDLKASLLQGMSGQLVGTAIWDISLWDSADVWG